MDETAGTADVSPECRKITRMDLPDRSTLLERVQALPAAAPLLARLGNADGVHLVGGAVRDLLLGGQPTDLDLVAGDGPEVAGTAEDLILAVSGRSAGLDRLEGEGVATLTSRVKG